MAAPSHFVFFTERRLVELTGLRARNLPELAAGVRQAPGASIFYHTHHQYLAHHFETPVFSNDFALWASQALQEEALAERLAAVDLLSFTSIRQLREAILAVMDASLASGGAWRESPNGDEFHFCRSKSFVMPTGLTAASAAEFFEILPRVTTTSLYFHFFEARLRLERPTNDFSAWLASIGHDALAQEIDRLNPYMLSLDELKQEMLELGRRHLGA
jgi:hypothetical protein